MHEYSVAAEIAEIVRQTAQNRPVKKITLAVGILSGIFVDSLLMYLEIVLPELGMEDVTVETKEVPATFLCVCNTEYTANSMGATCPACNGYNRSIKSGHDCTIESIEVDDD